MHRTKVYLNPRARKAVHNPESLIKKAEAVAIGIIAPPGIEFARFEHGGKSFALSARITIEVDTLDFRVPPVIVRRPVRKT